ncbi:hypothetical protein BH18VER1_BH18VER1_20570 [soil metagenome]
MTQSTHSVFSPRRIAALMANTLTELTRLKVFYVLLLFALLLIGSSAMMARLTFHQEFQVLKDVSLGAMSIFTSLLAIIATARMLPQDLEERTIYTILAKPVQRFEYLAGRLAGVSLLLLISIAVMSLLFCAVLFVREQHALNQISAQMTGAPPDQLQAGLQEVRNATFNADLLPGIGIIYLKACLLASLTLFISTFATTNIFTVVVAVFVYFIGHLQATAREFWLQEHAGTWLTRGFLAFVALVFPDLQLFDFADDVVTGATVPLALFAKAAGFGCFYIVLYLLLATAVFHGREL